MQLTQIPTAGLVPLALSVSPWAHEDSAPQQMFRPPPAVRNVGGPGSVCRDPALCRMTALKTNLYDLQRVRDSVPYLKSQLVFWSSDGSRASLANLDKCTSDQISALKMSLSALPTLSSERFQQVLKCKRSKTEAGRTRSRSGCSKLT